MPSIPNYKITGKYMNGASVIGFQLEDTLGNIKTYKTRDTEKLIEQGKIPGWGMVESDGQVYMCSQTLKISQVPTLSAQQRMTVTHRVLSNGQPVGYVAIDAKGDSLKITRDKLWIAARAGVVTNVAAQLSGRTKVLRGIGIELRSLPSIKE